MQRFVKLGFKICIQNTQIFKTITHPHILLVENLNVHYACRSFDFSNPYHGLYLMLVNHHFFHYTFKTVLYSPHLDRG